MVSRKMDKPSYSTAITYCVIKISRIPLHSVSGEWKRNNMEYSYKHGNGKLQDMFNSLLMQIPATGSVDNEGLELLRLAGRLYTAYGDGSSSEVLQSRLAEFRNMAELFNEELEKRMGQEAMHNIIIGQFDDTVMENLMDSVIPIAYINLTGL